MGKLKIIIFALFGIGFFVGLVLFILGYFRQENAGVLIETTPSATVFINNVQVGRTPYKGTFEPGEAIIKLIPDSFETPLSPFETKITLVSGIETIVRRDFGDTDDSSSGEIISFDRLGSKETSIAVVSIPDAAQISINGTIRGFAPYKTNTITPGDHQISIIAPGYTEKLISAKAFEGYKLTLVVKLAPNAEIGKSEEEKPQDIETKVEILDTPTGFLRVRGGPSTAFAEVGEVKPGDTFIYIETDEDSGWFKIEYLVSKDKEIVEGWVSGEYAKLIEFGEVTTISPSPSATPKN